MPAIYKTDLRLIAREALEKEEENDHFLRSLKNRDGAALDAMVHAVNEEVSAAIDCKACGNCCKTLVINITPAEIEGLATHLQLPLQQVEDAYIEESQQGQCFINSIPCHFLADNRCRIYDHRFTECRDFPHLHKNGFKERLLGTLQYYGSCPIIYNVIEKVKQNVGFIA